MITDVDTCLKDIADWYIRNRREIAEPELEVILLKHCEDEAEVRKFANFLETEPGQLRFKTLLREKAQPSKPSYLKKTSSSPEELTAGERNLLSHLTKATQKESNELFLRRTFGDDIFESVYKKGFMTGIPQPSPSKRIMSITLKGRSELDRIIPKAEVGVPEARVRELKHHEELVLQAVKDKPDITFPEVEQVTKLEPVQIDGAIRRLAREGMLEKTEGQMTPAGLTPSSYRLTSKALAIPKTESNQFIKVDERVRFIGTSRGRFETWPEGKWLEYGVTGTVKEYHPESPAVTVRGEYFEALPPYAVARWDFGGETVIDPEDEGKRWERIKKGCLE